MKSDELQFRGDAIHVRGAREHNLQGVDVDIPIGCMTVVTGSSGSGKTSLAMHTLYAEGQRRYMETFSPYVRQFMDRMDKPAVDSIENILPAIALEQRNTIRTSRSTVGTMTGLNDYWKFVFARLAIGHDPLTGDVARPYDVAGIVRELRSLVNHLPWRRNPAGGGKRGEMGVRSEDLLVCMDVPHAVGLSGAEMATSLISQGYVRVLGTRVKSEDGIVKSCGNALRAEDDGGRVLCKVDVCRDVACCVSGIDVDGSLRVVRLDELDAVALSALENDDKWCVVQDRVRVQGTRVEVAETQHAASLHGEGRLAEAVEMALRLGGGEVRVMRKVNVCRDVACCVSEVKNDEVVEIRRYRTDWFPLLEPRPELFSFNSPIGACPTCRGYGRVITLDYDRAVTPHLTLREGALHIFETEIGLQCKRDMMRSIKNRVPWVRTDVTWKKLTKRERDWCIYGDLPEGERDIHTIWDRAEWYGVAGVLWYMEKQIHKMINRVYVSKFRVYSECPACHGKRLRPESLQFEIGGKTMADLYQMPMDSLLEWLEENVVPRAMADNTLKHSVAELQGRLSYLCEVGLGYLTPDRSTRTLSGGEIERVSLTTCLGASLTDTLFVLDEPTVGLHPRDTENLLVAMQRLKNRGNTLLVVEHEEAVMRAANYLVDMGPGSGRAGGQVVYAGAPEKVSECEESLTGGYLSGRLQIAVPRSRRKGRGKLRIKDATCFNLHKVAVDIPLGTYTCLTGVSGSGKSTLANFVVFRNAQIHFGETSDEPPAPAKISGWQHLSGVVMVDQSPILRTPRSTPVVYCKIFEHIRALFASTDAAKARDLKPGYFSFNSGLGRCQRCMGMGSEKVEMQFLSDLFVQCPLCHGTRYSDEALGIKYHGKGIAEVLRMTVGEATDFFFDIEKKFPSPHLRRIFCSLDDLVRVGLGHLLLGQPLNTLSGGENQRLKLAKILMQETLSSTPKMIILDEPSTGLHFSDLQTILMVFEALVRNGHTLLVIEHNMELVKCADHVIDMGPEGGLGGGEVVSVGSPEQLANTDSHTGRALRELIKCRDVACCVSEAQLEDVSETGGKLCLRGARHHNLKNIDVDIHKGQMTVLTGLSGSGKSSLAFDIFFAEGQRRFMDVMSPYARQFTEQLESPDIDRLTGLPPTVAIAQNISRGGTKSTVGTVTEIWQFLRLLYAKLGEPHCPKCDVPVGRRSVAEIVRMVQDKLEKAVKKKKHLALCVLAPLVRGRKGHYADLARWAEKKGYARVWIDGEMVNLNDFAPLDRYVHHDIDLVIGELPHAAPLETIRLAVEKALEMGDGFMGLLACGDTVPEVVSTKLSCPTCHESMAEIEPFTFSYNSPRGWCPTCRGNGIVGRPKFDAEKGENLIQAELAYDKELERALQADDAKEQMCVCSACHGVRLNKLASAVRLQGLRPGELSCQSVMELVETVEGWKFKGSQAVIARDVVAEVRERLGFLQRVGLGYLSLDRSANTLSGGEAQRIRLAAQLGARLRGVLYILDEPTIGLHPSDNERLLATLADLRDAGNTLLVVEHDEQTMRMADRILDMGPGAGIHGGQIVADGTFEQLATMPDSVTGLALHGRPPHPYRGKRNPVPRQNDAKAWLKLEGCTLHNLKNVSASIPKGRLTVLTGVSGSGKTSLMTGTLREVAEHVVRTLNGCRDAACCVSEAKSKERGGGLLLPHCRAAQGFEDLRAVYSLDQSPIGKTPRSTPATYIGFLDDIRDLFAQSIDAKRLGFGRGRFSFNTAQGNCPTCKGTGMERIEMDFLPPCYVHCNTCRGKRYNTGTLAVRYKGKTIAEVLEMNFEDAAAFFAAQSRIAEPLRLMVDTGLGYLTLGQASNTLSGGEAQRLKLVTELIKGQRAYKQALLKGRALPNDLYLIEEPSVGLHPQDVRLLIEILHRLVEQGHTVVVVEHNTEIMAEADYIIDMGPGPGEQGGQIVAKGTPNQIARGSSPTAPYLRAELRGLPQQM